MEYSNADTPETPRACEIHNERAFEVICLPGNDGGLAQYFVLEVIGDDLSDGSQIMQESYLGGTVDNDMSTLNDEVQLLYVIENIVIFYTNNLYNAIVILICIFI